MTEVVFPCLTNVGDYDFHIYSPLAQRRFFYFLQELREVRRVGDSEQSPPLSSRHNKKYQFAGLGSMFVNKSTHDFALALGSPMDLQGNTYVHLPLISTTMGECYNLLDIGSQGAILIVLTVRSICISHAGAKWKNIIGSLIAQTNESNWKRGSACVLTVGVRMSFLATLLFLQWWIPTIAAKKKTRSLASTYCLCMNQRGRFFRLQEICVYMRGNSLFE